MSEATVPWRVTDAEGEVNPETCEVFPITLRIGACWLEVVELAVVVTVVVVVKVTVVVERAVLVLVLVLMLVVVLVEVTVLVSVVATVEVDVR